jgi:teichoic acid transport system permease protein
MTEIAVAGSQSDVPAAQLAARHGLSVAGARPSLPAYVRQLWAYRHFTTAYANGRMVAQFSTARLGRVWQVLNPLTNAAIYFLIFGVLLDTKRAIPNFIAYLCAGVFVFMFTQTTVQSGVQAITSNLGLIRALHFPRASLPLSITLMQFQNLVASVIVLLCIVLGTGEPITFKWLLLVPVLVLQAIFNGGLALAFARLGAKMADLKQVIPFVMRTWLYMSGVMYSVSLFEKHLNHFFAQVFLANPMLVYIELARDCLIRSDPPLESPHRVWALAFGWAVVALGLGFVYFWRGEQEYGRG